MPYDATSATCPCCGKTAHNSGKTDEIEKKFGWRIVNGKTIPQSYCRACRGAHCKAGQPCKVR